MADRKIIARKLIRIARELMTGSYANPIRIDDPDALERTQKELDERTALQERLKKAGSIIRKYDNDKDRVDALLKNGFDEEFIKNHLTGYAALKGCNIYVRGMENNGQAIQRLRKRLNEIARYQKELEDTGGDEDNYDRYEFDGGYAVDNVGMNRFQVFFKGKPDADVRSFLKRNGYRWSPSEGAWQCYRNRNSMNAFIVEFNARRK